MTIFHMVIKTHDDAKVSINNHLIPDHYGGLMTVSLQTFILLGFGLGQNTIYFVFWLCNFYKNLSGLRRSIDIFKYLNLWGRGFSNNGTKLNPARSNGQRFKYFPPGSD